MVRGLRPVGVTKATVNRVLSRTRTSGLDRFLPIANISRIHEYVGSSDFHTGNTHISPIDKCQEKKRKTNNGDDLLWAMATLGFEDYVDPLKAYLSRYREGSTKGSTRHGDGSGKKDIVGSQLVPNAQDLLLGFVIWMRM